MADISRAAKDDNPGVIVPPPLIFGVVLALALAVDGAIRGPGFGLSSEPRLLTGLLLAIAGMTLIIIAGVRFRAAKTHIEPWKPTTTLITHSLYRYSRNPIYLGLALGYAGISFLGDSILALVLLPLPVAIVHYGIIRREERYLEAKFGNEYRTYVSRVRRWI
jgi:protein-S-isoprenylcysteine O-methyltransferase Ste14